MTLPMEKLGDSSNIWPLIQWQGVSKYCRNHVTDHLTQQGSLFSIRRRFVVDKELTQHILNPFLGIGFG